MSLFAQYRDVVLMAVASRVDAGELPPGLPLERISVEPPRDPAHGDIATNAAMVLAGAAKMAPRALAERLIGDLATASGVSAASIAGPGFINLRLKPEIWRAEVSAILRAGIAYGASAIGGGEPVNVEYVSANPTGPMHVGHGRGAVVGDALASLLEKAGYRVTREYYVNDAGAQVAALARSLYARYLVAVGARPDGHFATLLAEGAVAYGGDYLIEAAQALAARDGSQWVDAAEDAWLPALRDFAVERMMALIEADLAAVGIRFDVTASERALVAGGGVDEAVALLAERGLLYTGVLEPPKGKLPDDWEPRPQTLFRATQFGDEVDRPLRKSDGSWTYFAADLAYHLDKFRRGFRTMIDVWGADHGGYVKRMQAGVNALTGGAGALDVKLCQLVTLLDGGEPVRMSKRAGTFVTLREVVDRVGRDVFRFIMLTRKNDAPLEFDFQTVTEQSKDNPVFYVQYAHARCCSVMRHAEATLGAAAATDAALAAAPLDRLADPAELDLIRAMAGWPRVIEAAAEAHEPHRIAFFLQELAALFHLLWTRGKEDTELRFLNPDDEALTLARLALVRATAIVIASGLNVIGVNPVEELR
ncbi:MAG: arginine--tRNA ligase [Rhodospirillales bacterium]|nr:arginine--tRNA ligase [Rhodospirillales bacterium]